MSELTERVQALKEKSAANRGELPFQAEIVPTNIATVAATSRCMAMIRPDGTVRLSGMDHGNMTVQSVSMRGFVVKEQGRNVWAGRGEQRYAPTEVQAFVWQDGVKFEHGTARGWAVPVCSSRTSVKSAEIAKNFLARWSK